MPAFMFEKISSPVCCGPITPALDKPRGVISQMIDRLARRGKRSLREEKSATRRDEKPSK